MIVMLKQRIKWVFGGLAVMLFVSSCSAVGPDFTKPELPAPERWLEEADPGIIADDDDSRDWWKSFNDPALDALIQRAYENNLSLEIAGLRIHEARAYLGVAIGTLYPQSTHARVGADRIKLSENADPIAYLPPEVQQGIDTEFSTYRLGFGTAWELDFWGRYRRIVEAADASLAARVAAYDSALVSVTGEVASAYIILRTLEQRLKVVRSNAAIQQRSAEISGVRHQNELTTELDVVQAQVQLKDSEAMIPRLEAALRETENALSMLIGAEPGTIRTIIGQATDIPTTPISVAVGMPADLIRRRPDIRQAEHLAAFQSARIGIAQADLYPSFSISGTIGLSADNVGDVFDSDSFGAIVGTGFRWNILNFGRIRNRIRANDALFQQAITRYEQVVLNAFREVETAQTAFLKAQNEIEFRSESVRLAERAVELALVQYRDGIADFTRVLTAQRALMFQENQLADAQGRVARNLVAIYRALGGGWQIREGQPFIPANTKDIMKERTNWGELLNTESVQLLPKDQRGKWRQPDR